MTKKYYKDNLIKQMAKERDEQRKEVDKKVRSYLEKKKYYEKTFESKLEYLLTKEGLQLLQGMSMEGLALVEIASVIKITQKALKNAMRDHPEIFDAIDEGRTRKINPVEEAMFNLAKDRTIVLKKTITNKSGRSSRVSTREEEKEKFIPADFRAAQYILDRQRHLEYQRKEEDDLVDENKAVSFVVQIPENMQLVDDDNDDED
jgi:hypothetical protein